MYSFIDYLVYDRYTSFGLKSIIVGSVDESWNVSNENRIKKADLPTQLSPTRISLYFS
jgi:hypothetical protein